MEVPSARPHTPAAIQHIAPVGAAVEGVVILIVGVLHGEDALLRVLVLGEEDVAEVLEVAILGLLYHSSILDDFLYVLLVDVADAGIGLIAVAPGQGQIALGEVGSSGDLVGASALALCSRQHVVGKLEVGNDLLHQFLVGELVIRRLLLGVVLIDFLVDPGHLVPELDEFEVEVSTEETHLTLADAGGLGTKFLLTILSQRYQCTVAAADRAVEVIPEFVHVVGGRSGQRRPYLHGVIVGIGGTRAALHSIVGRDVAVRPEVERIGVPVVAEFGVGSSDHLIGLAHREVLADDALGINVDEVVAGGEGCYRNAQCIKHNA